MGRVLSTRSFRRYIVTEIITKTWYLQYRVNIEKVEENCFKFTFGSKEDKEKIYKYRPWSLNGAHLILKEWPEDIALQEINFDTSTFHLQVHGFPPIFLHERTIQHKLEVK